MTAPTSAAAPPWPPVTSLAELRDAVAQQLAGAGIPDAEVDARWLIAHVADVDPHRSPHAPVESTVLPALAAATSRRMRHEPLQLILGSAPFLDLDLVCEPGVFIPRPETEVLALAAIDHARTLAPPTRIVEPCTGTGAITCALLGAVSGADIIASDIDPRAVELATRNVRRVREGIGGVRPASGARAVIRHGSLLDPVRDQFGAIDLLVANPPYLPADDARTWQPEVAEHDPRHALVGGPDGHELVDTLIELATHALAPGGRLLLEIDERKADVVQRRAVSAGMIDVGVIDDLAGRPRVLAAAVPGERSAP